MKQSVVLAFSEFTPGHLTAFTAVSQCICEHALGPRFVCGYAYMNVICEALVLGKLLM
jgi:hypothetical protein